MSLWVISTYTCIPTKRPGNETYIPKIDLRKKLTHKMYVLVRNIYRYMHICNFAASYGYTWVTPKRDLGKRPTYPTVPKWPAKETFKRDEHTWEQYIYMYIYIHIYVYVYIYIPRAMAANTWHTKYTMEKETRQEVQPVAFGVSFLQSQISIDRLVL